MAPHIGVVIDDVVSSLNRGDEVVWAYCHNALPSCWINRDGKRGACALCHRMYKEYAKEYATKATMYPIKYSDITHQKREIIFATPESVRSFEYRGVKVGMSILSTYYTYTRDLDIADFDGFKNYAIPLAKSICDMVDYSYSMIERIKPDEIIILNGRHFSNRFLYDICRNNNVAFRSLEVIGLFSDLPFRKISYKNCLPHSIQYRKKMIEELWEKSTDSKEQKIDIADRFYSKRRNGEIVADVKAYVKNQKAGLLPDDFDETRRNIAIFNSSADEFSALGDEWDDNLLFSTQYEAIKYLLENSSSGIHFYLRIHPNLIGVNHKAHLDLYKLSEYSNITIIHPEDKISTYSLMEKCEKTITFGSTMGVEACYWGKPSIMIGHAYYETQNVCYIPKTKDELIKLIDDTELKPKPKEGSIKYAYFVLDKKFTPEPTNINIGIRNKKLGVEFMCADYLRIWGKSWLFQLANLFFERIPRRL